MKKIISFALGAGMFLTAAGPAFAANQCGNQTTGPSSINACVRALVKTKALTLTNSGTVGHSLTATNVSGGNTSNTNTTGGTVAAGKATSTVAKIASLNTGVLTVDQTDPVAEDQGVNDTTGPSSNNQVSLTTVKTVTLGVNNSGSITQTITSNSTSGNNQANGNTVGGSVTTGDATSDITVQSVMNDFVITVTQ